MIVIIKNLANKEASNEENGIGDHLQPHTASQLPQTYIKMWILVDEIQSFQYEPTHNFPWKISPCKVTWIYRTDQQKSDWFESYFKVSFIHYYKRVESFACKILLI